MFHAKCSYDGQKTKDGKRMHGFGVFTFADGSKYVGAFHDGAFHGHGIVFFTDSDGAGQYRGIWEHGTNLSGQYFFADGLPFDAEAWSHCTEADRRMWNEALAFVQPCDATVTAEGAAAASKMAAAGSSMPTITPDYATTDGVPGAFAAGKPRGYGDVTEAFWRSAPPPAPEHELVRDAAEGPETAEIIAQRCPRPH
jgi:hypothetical protein